MSVQAQRSSSPLRLLFSLLLIVVAFYVFINRQDLLDRVNYSLFKPNASIAAIAERSSFDENGTFLFYASQPELLDREGFNAACRSVATEQTAILGCYSANRIYLFDVDNERLDGVEEVTAAHEMLHAAYQRLSDKEKTRIHKLLTAQDLGSDTERIGELMDQYAISEPGEELNELHSIIGSEIASLSPELEAYYSQYFENRQQLVRLAKQYQSVFDELQSRQNDLAAELDSLADSIEKSSAVYERELQVLENDIRRFNDRASGGSLTRNEYDTERSALASRQSKLKRDYTEIQAMIEIYEDKRAELAAINSESNALNRSLNSSVAPGSEELDG